jgi:hypothetical protein
MVQIYGDDYWQIHFVMALLRFLADKIKDGKAHSVAHKQDGETNTGK